MITRYYRFSSLERRNHHFKNVFMEAACFFHLPFFFKKTSKTIHICFLVLHSLAKRDFIIFYYIWCLLYIYHLYIVFQSYHIHIPFTIYFRKIYFKFINNG